MYIAAVKTAFIEALRQVFDNAYPASRAKDLHISGEFPESTVDFPGIWVTYTPDPEVRVVGLKHREYVVDPDGTEREVTRWRGSGTVMMTVYAYSAAQRDLLVDELIRVIAFAEVSDPYVERFRESLLHNDLIGMSIRWGTSNLMGFSESPSTPWGTNDNVAEATVSLELECTFVPDRIGSASPLIPLSRIIVKEWAEGYEPKPVFAEEGVDAAPGDAEDGWI